MANAAAKKDVLLLMDSRGALIQKELNSHIEKNKLDLNIEVEFIRGGNIKAIAEKGSELLQEKPYDCCMFFAGVNNATRKQGKGCELRFTNVQSMVSNFTTELQRAYDTLHKVCNSVVICHLIGLDIAKYNKAPPSEYNADQLIINNAVGQINKNINKMNIDHQVKGPWLDDTIHSGTAKKVIHKYKRLSDGLHPDKPTVKLWAKKILASL